MAQILLSQRNPSRKDRIQQMIRALNVMFSEVYATIKGASQTSTAVSTGTGTTLAAAAIAGGIITRTGPSAAFADVTDTAVNIIAALPPNIAAGDAFEFTYTNNSSYAATLTGGAGVVLQPAGFDVTPGPVVVPTLNSAKFLGQVDSANKVTLQVTSALPPQTLTVARKAIILAPLPADVTTVVNAVTPTNVALTIAAQPPQARKLQVNINIGTTTTTAITAGTLTLAGLDQDGNAASEVISLIKNTTTVVKSKWAYSKLTSATVAGYVASGSGTGNTVGIGPSNDFGVPTGPGVTNFALVKATKIITTFVSGTPSWARAVTDDTAGSAVVDATARTVAPTTAPGSAGINDYELTCTYSLPV
jgi:hypothetical protein